MRRRIVITGMGAITPLGHTVEELFHATIAGKSGVGPITRFDATTFPTRFAAEVRGFDLARHVRHPEVWKDACDASQFAAAASRIALEDAGLLASSGIDESCANPYRFGVYIGTGEATQEVQLHMSLIGRSYDAASHTINPITLGRISPGVYSPGKQHEQELHTLTGHLAEQFNLLGPNYSCLTACAAGTQAIGEALEQIRYGDADLMLAGGAHSMVYPLGVTGFSLLTALSKRNDNPQGASRPFDRFRDGFVVGEGAAVVILEELEHARKRGANIYAEMTGYGSTADAFRVTDAPPDGRGAIACMRAALADARLTPNALGYINAHGTSTRINDLVETIAIKKVFGDHAYQLPVSSSKSMLGHLIGAAGAVELVLCIMAIREGVLPPTINYETPDPDCDLDYIPNVPRQVRVQHVLSNSFGFGGQNSSLIVSRFEG